MPGDTWLAIRCALPTFVREFIITGQRNISSAWCGEHLSVDNMNQAIKLTANDLSIVINEYCGWQALSGLFAHHWYIGLDKAVDAAQIRDKLDDILKCWTMTIPLSGVSVLKGSGLWMLPNQAFYWFSGQ